MSDRYDKLKAFAQQLSKCENVKPEGFVEESIKFSIDKENNVTHAEKGSAADTSFMCSISVASGSGIIVHPQTMKPTICLPSVCVRIEGGNNIGEDEGFMKEYDFRLMVHPISAALLYIRMRDYLQAIGVEDVEDLDSLAGVIEKAKAVAERVDLDDVGGTFPKNTTYSMERDDEEDSPDSP
jgi:hypothetical protein